MSDNIVSIRGAPLPQTASPDPDPEVVDYLKMLLGLAETGDLQGIVTIGIHAGERFSCHDVGATVSECVVGHLHVMALRISVDVCEGDED